MWWHSPGTPPLWKAKVGGSQSGQLDNSTRPEKQKVGSTLQVPGIQRPGCGPQPGHSQRGSRYMGQQTAASQIHAPPQLLPAPGKEAEARPSHSPALGHPPHLCSSSCSYPETGLTAAQASVVDRGTGVPGQLLNTGEGGCSPRNLQLHTDPTTLCRLGWPQSPHPHPTPAWDRGVRTDQNNACPGAQGAIAWPW